MTFLKTTRGSGRGMIAHMEQEYLFMISMPVLARISTILGSIPTRAPDLVRYLYFFSYFHPNYSDDKR